jgi:hypothetical protein
MDDKQIVALLRRQISNAQDNGPDPTALAKAMDYYYGRARGDEVVGRSQVQSLDVADMTHAVMAQILPSFTQDAICQFEPDGPDDDAPARLETDAVNRVVMESSRGYTVLYEAIKDALLCKNGVVKVYLDDNGDRRRLVCKAVDPLCFVVGPGQDSVLLEDYGGFCAERKEYRRAELVAMGFPEEQVARIHAGAEVEGDGRLTGIRNRQGQDSIGPDSGWANERVMVWECYAELPSDEDASSTRLYRCLLGSQELLLKERADYIPYACGTGFMEPHKFWGLSLFDRLKTVQDAKTAILRQWLDNLANCNNSRQAINDRVDLDDITDSRPGGKVRVSGIGPVQDSIMPLPSLDAGPAAAAFLQYMDQVRADRGGAALVMANAESQLTQGAIGSQGVDRIFSVQEAMAGMIARTLAETLLRSLFLLVHRLLRTEYGEPLVLRLADQWVQVDPSQWRQRDRVNIKSGLSPGEKSRKVAALSQVLAYQWQTIQAGQDGVMVTLPNLYNAYLDWASAQDLDAGEKYFTDPESQTALQGMQQKIQQNQQQQGQQAQLMQVQIQLEQQKLQIDQQKAQIEAMKADAELKFKYWMESLHAEIEEAKLTATVTADLAAQQQAGRDAAAGDSGAAGAGRAAA